MSELNTRDIMANNNARLAPIHIGGIYDVRVHGKSKFSTSNNGSPYPDWDETDVPVQIIGDYGTWWLCDVLPHVPAHPVFGSPSKPYRVTIDKVDVILGQFTLTERRE